MSDLMSILSSLLCLLAPAALFCIPVVLIIGGIGFLIYRNHAGTRKAWTSFAASNGLTYQPSSALGSGAVTGSYRGRGVNLHSYSSGSGRYRSTWTLLTITANNSRAASLSITPQGILGSVAKAMGGQDILIGAQEFDKKYRIQANPPELALAVLAQNEGLRAQILEVAPSAMEYKDQSAVYRVSGIEDRPERLDRIFRLLCDFADAVEGAG
jgi:hypothetical protein